MKNQRAKEKEKKPNMTPTEHVKKESSAFGGTENVRKCKKIVLLMNQMNHVT